MSGLESTAKTSVMVPKVSSAALKSQVNKQHTNTPSPNVHYTGHLPYRRPDPGSEIEQRSRLEALFPSLNFLHDSAGSRVIVGCFGEKVGPRRGLVIIDRLPGHGALGQDFIGLLFDLVPDQAGLGLGYPLV